MSDIETTTSNGPSLFRLDRIKNRIVLVALLATLIPSLGMAWVSYAQNKRALTEKITQQLEAVSSQAARELDLWIGEQIYDLKVFTFSYEVSENLDLLPAVRDESIGRLRAFIRLRDYLTSVLDRSPHFGELIVVDARGQTVVSSADSASDVQLPPDWLDAVREDQVIGEPYWDDSSGKPTMMIAYAIEVSDIARRRFLGSLVARLNFDQVDSILARFSPGDWGEAFVMDGGGRLIMSSRPGATDGMQARLAGETVNELLDAGGAPVEYTDYRGEAVVGASRMIPRLEWRVVAEIPREEAFAQVAHLRNTTILILSLLLLGVGLVAYRVGAIIVRPLDRLTRGVKQVAVGDFSVDLPVQGGGEVGDLTAVFNDMVARLRKGRDELDAAHDTLKQQNEELERLSITDGLTGLSNRRRLMEVLDVEARRAKRHKRPFALVMLDVDHFKQVNDTHGHLAGDEVLKRLASLLREEIREVDYAARYGGEEFLLMLPETDLDGGAEVAERIRARMATEKFAVDGDTVTITVSGGVTECPEAGEPAEAVIARADDALYKAKRRGRNRVVRADGKAVRRKAQS